MSVRKFSPEQVVRIRERAAAGELKKVVAFDYGAAIETIRDVTIGVTYRDCGGPLTTHNNAMTQAERETVIAMVKQGESMRAISRAVGRHHDTCRKIRNDTLKSPEVRKIENRITNRSGAKK